MQAAKILGSFAACALFAGLATAQESSATQILARSMQRTFGTNIVAVILQRDPRMDGAFQRVKVERNREGMARCTILAPLRMLGITSVDDGDTLKTYLPDDKVLIEQESPGVGSNEVDSRINLAKKNYSFRLAQNVKVAGREAVCVVATPKNSELEVRRYYLDHETAYPLRLETYSDGNEITVVFDTKLIEYPKGMDSKLFELEPMGNVRLVSYSKPNKVVSDTQAKAKMGFAPLVPQGLPLGFKVTDTQFSEGKELKSIVVRLSDGLARATVYQWRADADVKLKSIEDSTMLTHNGLKLMLVSDLGPSVRLELLKAFISQALTDPALRAQRLYGAMTPLGLGLQASLELVSSVWAFSGIDSLNGVVTNTDDVRGASLLPPNP